MSGRFPVPELVGRGHIGKPIRFGVKTMGSFPVDFQLTGVY